MALDNIPTPSWAVVYGEVPSASKWSELGANDDSLATGAGWDDDVVLERHIPDAEIPAEKLGMPIAFKARRSGNQTVANATVSTIVYNSEVFDYGGLFSPATGKITATLDGPYAINAAFELDAAGTKTYIYIYVNNVLVGGTGTFVDNTTDDEMVFISDVLDLNAGDVVDIRVWHTAGASRSLLGDAGLRSFFSGNFIGRTD